MQTTVTARHCEIPDDLRARALDLAEKLAKVAHRPQRMEIVFDNDHQHVASAEATDFRSALDRAVEKLRSQLDKGAARATRRQPTA